MSRLVLILLVLGAGGCSVDTSPTLPGDTGVRPDAAEDAGDASRPDARLDAGDTSPTDTGPACGPAETSCGGECVDLDTDLRHCGACMNECPAAPEDATARCAEGGCAFICDDGFAPDGAGGCVPNECGDGYLDASEACDDGNMVSSDGCSYDACTVEGGTGACGATQLILSRAAQSYRGQILAADSTGMACDGVGQEAAFMLAVNFPGNLALRVRPAGFRAIVSVYDSSMSCPGTPAECGTGSGAGDDVEVSLGAVVTGERFLVVISSADDLGATESVDFVLEATGF